MLAEKFEYRRLRHYRHCAQMTLKEAAEKAGISERSLARYETGERDITLSLFLKLARIYNVDVLDALTVCAPMGYILDVPLYNLVISHCDYLIGQRIESDLLFNYETDKDYYDRQFNKMLKEYASDPLYGKIFPGLGEAKLPDKYFRDRSVYY